MAETAQRFVVHAEKRKFARVAGYPAGLVLVVAAVFMPADVAMAPAGSFHLAAQR